MVRISFFKRLLILLYESFLLLAIAVVTAAPVTIAFEVIYDSSKPLLQQPSYLLFLLYVLSVLYLYFWFCWVRGGQTLAMKAWRCKVVSDTGENISNRQALIRYLSGWISLIFFGAGFLLSLFRDDNAALHDLWSKSYIVSIPKNTNADE